VLTQGRKWARGGGAWASEGGLSLDGYDPKLFQEWLEAPPALFEDHVDQSKSAEVFSFSRRAASLLRVDHGSLLLLQSILSALRGSLARGPLAEGLVVEVLHTNAFVRHLVGVDRTGT